jgi:uncharacterized protein YjbI with pentapeptide repeats
MVLISVMMVLSIIAAPLKAQDAWPEGCEWPDVDSALNAAAAGRAQGDPAAYMTALSEVAQVVNDTRVRCLLTGIRDGLDWIGTDLHGIDLSERDLCGAILDGANLSGANLQGTFFTGMSMEVRQCDPVSLVGADLTGANLAGAWLFEANLLHAILDDAVFTPATQLPNGEQWTPDTDMARFTDHRHPDFDPNLYGWDLAGVDLSGANLSRAWLNYASLIGADLSDADLEWAKLEGTDLEGANLQGANLTRADLEGANLLHADLTGAILSTRTTLPDGSRWTEDTDMARFTDPAHPDFWRSDEEYSPAYAGEEQ